jgi:TatD DNase family protein
MADLDEGSNLSSENPRFVDIGANLLDLKYQGTYYGKPRHNPDLDSVLNRAWQNNLDRILLTAGTLEESKRSLELSRTDDRLFSTAGVHPTRCSSELGEHEDSWDTYWNQLREIIKEGIDEGKIIAMGEMGLDYDRLEFCDAATQRKGFIAQLKIAKEVNLPLFLHNRNVGNDLLEILKEHYFTDVEGGESNRAGGVVHSFDDTIDLALKFIDLGLYIGLNGCSLKTPENLAVVKELPLDKILLETDCPWCDIRPSHAGGDFIKTKFPTKQEKKYEDGCCVKGRYEPCHIIQVAEVIAGVKEISVQDVADATRKNAYKLFQNMN